MSLDHFQSTLSQVLDTRPRGYFNSRGIWVEDPGFAELKTKTATLFALAASCVCPSCHRFQTYKISGTEVLFCTDPYHRMRQELGVTP